MTHLLIYQHNKSAIPLEINGVILISKRTKCIKAKFFFVTNKIIQGKVQVVHILTKQMWINTNTKPKQGMPFGELSC